MLGVQKKVVKWNPKPGQSERDLLKKYAGKDGRYCDPDFPCDESSLFRDGEAPEDHIPYANVLWLRPEEYIESGAPIVFVDDAMPGDVIQGKLGDCWFLSALSCVASRRDLLENLFASTEFANKGIYTVRFFKNGRWKHVTIDDRIPCGPTGKPLYGTCRDPRQIWVTLLEKAYAKINGRCYQNLVGGTMTFALKDLTGGDPQMVNLLDPQTADECVNGFLWQKFKLWVKQNNLLGCAWKQGRKDNKEEDFDGGIVRGHAYSVLDVKEHHSLKFMKVRNPWGMKEWKGPWADGAPEWDNMPADAPDWMVNYRPAEDGVFWMLFEDFVKYFNTVYVCIMFPPSWTEELLRGRFTTETSGGAPDPSANNYWWINPTYRLTVTTKTQLFISVAQRDTRMIGNKQAESASKRDWNAYTHAIGFIVARETAVSRCKRTKGDKKLRGSDIVAKSSAFKKDRDVSVSQFPVVLEPRGGPYVLIPMTYEPQADLKYYVTVRSNRHVKLEEYNVPEQVDASADAELDDDEDEDEDEDESLKGALPKGEDDTEKDKGTLEPSLQEAIAMCKRQPPVETAWVVDEGSGMKFVDRIFLAAEFPAVRMDKDPKRPRLDVSKWTSAVEWRRPAQIDMQSYMPSRGPGAAPIKASLIKPGSALPGDVVQGALTNTWFLGAASALSTRPELLASLFVDHSPACETYGVYTVRLYKNGMWNHVVIDDKLPVTTDGHFLFSRCKDPSELWLPLLEKAYAKLHGCYECLMQGSVQFALQDLTAGAPQVVKFSDPDVDFRIKNGMMWKEMDALLHAGSILSVQLREEGKKGGKAVNKMGLLAGHAYTVIELKEFDLKRMGLERYRDEWTLRLIKLRNPWGKGDFAGQWGPKSETWRKYEPVANDCQFRDFDTGYFWMSAGDFFGILNTLYVCRMFKTPDPWRSLRFTDCWKRAKPDAAGVISNVELDLDNAKGPPSRKDPSAWLSNPQFLIFVKEKTPCLIVLSQKDARIVGGAQAANRIKGGHALESYGRYDNEIGFAIARASVVREKGPRMKKSDFFAVAKFRRDRDVTTPFTLQLSPKDSPYIVFPMTAEPGMEGGFVLNLYVKSDVFVRGGGRIKTLPHEHDDSDEEVDAFENEPVEGMEEIIVANPDSLPGASGKAGGAGGKTGEGTSSGADGPDAGPKEGDSDLYKALFTICTELGQKLDTEQKRGLAKALGL